MHDNRCPKAHNIYADCRCDEIELREREAERKPDTATGTVQTVEKPLPDFSDIFEREAAYRARHGLSEDAIIFPDELYTREEMVVRAQAELWKACHGPNAELRRGGPPPLPPASVLPPKSRKTPAKPHEK